MEPSRTRPYIRKYANPLSRAQRAWWPPGERWQGALGAGGNGFSRGCSFFLWTLVRMAKVVKAGTTPFRDLRADGFVVLLPRKPGKPRLPEPVVPREGKATTDYLKESRR